MSEFPRFDVEGRIALVTGAARGLGRAISLALANAGADVALGLRDIHADAGLPAGIEALGRRALPLAVDVRDDAQVQELARRTLAEFGRADFLINNAGALWWMDMLQTPMKRFDLVMGVNARGAFACTQAFLPSMVENRYGHILMMSPPASISFVAFVWVISPSTKWRSATSGRMDASSGYTLRCRPSAPIDEHNRHSIAGPMASERGAHIGIVMDPVAGHRLQFVILLQPGRVDRPVGRDER